MVRRLVSLLRLPETRAMGPLDDAGNQALMRRILARKPLLRAVYHDFYRQILAGVDGRKPVVELGSGVGFLPRLRPDVITSDILPYQGLDLSFSGLALPFRAGSVGAFVMVDVFHHVQDAGRFLGEMSRCLQPGGRIVMVEPANTRFARFVYRKFHHEGFDLEGAWTMPAGGPLSQANMALPWIVFSRDEGVRQQRFPELQVLARRYHSPLQYLVSGGLSLRQLLPSSLYGPLRQVERWLSPWARILAMFVTVEIEKATIADRP